MANFIDRAKFSCALGGALTTIAGLPKAVPIVHASGGCAAALSNTYNLASGYRGTGYCGGSMIPTSNVTENNIVFGGEKRLEEQIEETIKAIDADLYIVVTGCQVEIIGDDAVGISGKFREENVIGASTPGFLGNTFKGYDAVLNAIIKEVIESSSDKEDKTVNLFGVVPGHDVFYRGNLEELRRLLGLIGIKANTFFGEKESIETIKSYAKASLNVVLSTQAGVLPAITFEDLHHVPYVLEDIPIGPSGTEKFLRNIGRLLQVEEKVIEEVIEQEKKTYYSYLERIVDIYSDIDFQRYAIVVADSYYAYSLTRFLANDLGWIPHLVSINDISEIKDQEEYYKKFADITSETTPFVYFRENAGDVIKDIRNSWRKNNNQKYYDSLSPAFVVGSGIERSLAEKLGAGFLAVAFPVSNRVVLNKTYVGFFGGISLVEDLISSLVSAR